MTVVVRGIAPDFVVLDVQLSMKTIVYHQLDIPLISMETMPLSFPDPYVPPFTSAFIPSFSRWSKFWIYYLWQHLVMKRKFFNLFNAIFLFGQDYHSLHRKLANIYNFPFQQQIDLKRSFVTGVKNIKTLVIPPACFDFPRKHFPDCYFAESRIDTERDEKIVNKRYLQVIKSVCLIKQIQPETRLIYCSLGTVTSETGNRYEIFFKKMKKLCLLCPDCIFIMAVGLQYNITQLLPLPVNMYVFQQVPQMDILKHCDLMITHGGMNSIAECIWNGVPMLVFPLSLKWDQPGNSAKVVYHGLGIRGDIQKDAVRQIEKKLCRLKRNYLFFKRNLLLMKQKMYFEFRSTPTWLELFHLSDKIA